MITFRRLISVIVTLVIVITLFITGVVGYLIWGTFFPELVRVNIPVKNLPPSMDGFSILHLSDLHSARFGSGQKGVLRLIKNERVDMVAMTGDLVDARKKVMEPGLELVENAGALAPVYYVPGNHELAGGLYEQFKKKLIERNVMVLDNGSGISHPVGNNSLTVIGVGLNGKTTMDCEKLGEKGPVILLSHYPWVFESYAGRGVDLILAGHTHGGQIRLPWVGALWVPGQGKFPKYDAGLFYRDGTYLYINRGLGTSSIPVRFFCRPEVTLITLTRE